MNGLIFIYSNEIYLRFIESEVFSDIEKNYNITYVLVKSQYLSQELEKSSGLLNKKIVWINFIPDRFTMWNEFFDISCSLNKNESPSFLVRYQELSRENPDRYQRIDKLSSVESYKVYREKIEEQMGFHAGILKTILLEQPDFIIIPSSILDLVTDDILQITDYLKIPTFLLVSGWDNLSSKGLLYRKPSIVGVWGEQSKRHAIEIQKMREDQVFVIGSPHYEIYREETGLPMEKYQLNINKPPNEKIALFAGTFRLFDETQLLQEIDDAIESGNLPQIHLIYRPHPYRANRSDEKDFFDHSWRHITFDPQLAKIYSQTKKGIKCASDCKSFYEIGYLRYLYQTVDMVISPMSTVLLEAMMFGRPILAIAFNDQKHSWSADKVSRMYHFKELYENEDILVCRKRDEIFAKIRQLCINSEDFELSNRLKNFSEYFVTQRDPIYSKKLLLYVNSFFSKSDQKTNTDKKFTNGKNFRRKIYENLLLSDLLLISYYKNIKFKCLKRKNKL